jgi:hypothetical protein
MQHQPTDINMLSEPHYSIKWFNAHKKNWTKILRHLKDVPIKYLEVGVWEGQATRWMFDNFNITEAHVYDTFEGGEEHTNKKERWGDVLVNLEDTFKHNIKPHADRVHIHKGFSQIELRKNTDFETFDVIYIDGSHIAKDVIEDAILCWRLLKNDGIMIFDDYKWGSDRKPSHRPKYAIEAFLLAMDEQYESLFTGWQKIIKKV